MLSISKEILFTRFRNDDGDLMKQKRRSNNDKVVVTVECVRGCGMWVLFWDKSAGEINLGDQQPGHLYTYAPTAPATSLE